MPTYPGGPTILGNTTHSPVIESIGSCCLLREQKMLLSRRLFLESLGAAALAVQVRSFRALSSMVDRLAWQREAKFGMFIHWGPYSVAGVEASWPIMAPTGEISEAEYRALPARFNPVRFDPKAWIDLARKCGQRYMVLTAKHSDGFCMFDGDYTNDKITRTLNGNDVAREPALACRQNQMPLGSSSSQHHLNHHRDPNTSNTQAT